MLGTAAEARGTKLGGHGEPLPGGAWSSHGAETDKKVPSGRKVIVVMFHM